MKGHIFYTDAVTQSEAYKFAMENNMQTIDMTELGSATALWCERIKKYKIEKEGWTDNEF
ncbi:MULTISPECIES: hypothetical protein [Bacteroides]|uniref:hypothetical protein n=1 Tax=Bacteroides TaxID=816 RepID=UPI000B39C09B|nr:MULTISPECIES: hypothetical protein [Bacteroides]MBM6943895.1 hypothetical protein [Bacteroides gallinaceum]OUO63185.1 hypothetical protein B5F78_01170 [Bacteroides sp. An279]